jgi:peptidoglycan hydrolase CwlO-like protein
METEQILSGLTALLEEQKESLKQVNAIKSVLEHIDIKIDDLEKKITNIKAASNPGGNEMLAGLRKEIKTVQELLSNMPKNVKHEKRVLFFPEHNAKEYYSVILRWILYIIIATYSCYLLKHLMDNLTR